MAIHIVQGIFPCGHSIVLRRFGLSKLHHNPNPRYFRTKATWWGLKLLLLVSAILGAIQAGGCYYWQAASGQMEILRKRTPIPEVIDDPESSEQLKLRLATIQEARQFAVDVVLNLHKESREPSVKSYGNWVLEIARPQDALIKWRREIKDF